MKNRLSHSAVSMYTTCPRKYKFHYIEKLRSKNTTGALLFGSALDKALDHLLNTKNLEEAKDVFIKHWNVQEINDNTTILPLATNIVYSQRDYDGDLILDSNELEFEEVKKEYSITSDKSLKQLTAFYRELKKEKGFANFTEEQKVVYNFGHWSILLNKGLIMLEGYHKEILPKVKRVITSQKKIEIVNAEDDSIIGYIDLIVEWEDGKIYILDNKTSTMEYDHDSAMRSQQLILYYHATKDDYKVDGVGFIVLSKQLEKNKKKICSKCGYDGSAGRHKTCPQIEEVQIKGPVAGRCNGEWTETIDPKVKIDVILNSVSEQAENLVLETFDEANQGIKKGVFNPNLSACTMYGTDNKCPFYEKCWSGKDDDLICVTKKTKE